jgi:hypothetical protein
MTRLNFFSLPPYAPQHNPDEYLNNDITQNIHRHNFPQNGAELRENIQKFMRSLQKRPAQVKAYFRAESVRYAEGI